MPAWLSPFPIPAELAERLAGAGWSQWEGGADTLPPEGCLLYGAPDQLLAGSALSLEALLEGYRSLLALPQPGPRLLHLARLARCSDAQLAEGAAGLLPAADGVGAELDPLAAGVITLLAPGAPALIDGYLDLELRADLLGDEPDLAYRQRLREACRTGDLLAAWRTAPAAQAVIEVLRAELAEAREEAELTLVLLHQVQEELEQIFLADREKGSQLEQVQADSAGLKAKGEALRAELAEQRERAQQAEAALEAKDSEISEAREEAELTLLQLHQVQEELEHYFLLSRGQKQLLSEHQQLASGLVGALAASGARDRD